MVARNVIASPVGVEPDPLTPAYDALGVEGYYKAHGSDYRNPHEDAVGAALRLAAHTWQLDLSHVLDLACGSGEATLVLRSLGAKRVDGIDPYTGQAYLARTGVVAAAVRFEDIALGSLAGGRWSAIVCSYALHLIEASWLPAVCRALAEASDTLVVITPHKRPEIRSGWGWGPAAEIRHDRTRSRLYRRAAL